MEYHLKGLLLFVVFILLTACSKIIYKDEIMPYLTKDAVVEILLTQNKSITELTEEDLIDIHTKLNKEELDKDEIPIKNKQWIIVPSELNKHNHHLLKADISTGLRSWQVNSKRNIFLLLRHQETAVVSVKKPSHLKGKQQANRKQQITPLSAQGEAPDEWNASAWHQGLEKVDLFYNFDKVLQAGNYIITQVYYDQKTNSEHFTFLAEPNKQIVFPTLSNIKMNAHGIELKFEKANSDITNWQLNLIAFKLDKEPLIIPIEVELTANKDSLTFPLANINFEDGLYQIYIDTGDKLNGPYELTF